MEHHNDTARPGSSGPQLVSSTADPAPKTEEPLTLFTFGDSILDCAGYNKYGLDPGQLLVSNDDHHFPEFKGQDLSSRGPVKLVHLARDGAVVTDLAGQMPDFIPEGRTVALVTIGGNDLLRGLAADTGASGVVLFENTLSAFLSNLRVGKILVGTVYDPTCGDDSQNFLSLPVELVRRNHRRVNEVLIRLGEQYGSVVDLEAHFLRGDRSWFTQIYEPSLLGASEVRNAFLKAI